MLGKVGIVDSEKAILELGDSENDPRGFNLPMTPYDAFDNISKVQ